MGDVEQALSERLRAAVEHVRPSDAAPQRIVAQARRRRRRRRALLGVTPALALAGAGALATALILGPDSVRSSSARPRGLVPTSAGPQSNSAPFGVTRPPATGDVLFGAAGSGSPAERTWTPVAFGDVQLSVPPGSVIGQACPDPSAPVTVFFGGRGAPVACPDEPVGTNTIVIQPLVGSRSSSPPPTTINGIGVDPGFGSPATTQYSVPSLGVSIMATGTLAREVVTTTLARSPRSVTLASGRAPPIPHSWRRVTFGGLSIAVPRSWPVQHTVTWGVGCGPGYVLKDAAGSSILERPSLVFDSGRRQVGYFCPDFVGPWPVQAAVDGAVIDPGGHGPLSGGTTVGRCQRIASLRACPVRQAPYGVLVLEVVEPGGHRVGVEIGLGGNGLVARTILRSLRPSPA